MRGRPSRTGPGSLSCLLCLLLCWLCLPGTSTVALAEDRGFSRSSEARTQAPPERRVALVIGNGRYRHTNPLAGTRHDADAVAAALDEVGFEVIRARDLDRRDLILKILEFGDRLKTADIGFFYYSGHGVQVDGRNYLVPIDANIPNERYVELDAVNLDEVLRAMEDGETRLNIVVLDACRNNPFASTWFSSTRSTSANGLATLHPTRGFLIAYATNPGNVALDGGDDVGPYAGALAAEIRAPGRELSAVFRSVFETVSQQTNDAQIPWFESVYSGDFYLLPIDTADPPPPEKLGERVAPRRELERELALNVHTGLGLAAGRELDATIGGAAFTESALHWLVPAALSVELSGERTWLRLGAGGTLNLSGPYLFAGEEGAAYTYTAGELSLAGGLSSGRLDLGLMAGPQLPSRLPVRLVGRLGGSVGVELRLGLNVVTERPVEPAAEILFTERVHLAGPARP